MNIANKRILVTGGAGFLGRNVCDALRKRNPAEIIVPRKAQYDLTEQSLARKLLDDSRPDVIVHLAAVVGGISANLENPGKYFYENAVMGILLLEEARKRGVGKFANGYRKRATPPTASPRKPSWCKAKPTASNTARASSRCCR